MNKPITVSNKYEDHLAQQTNSNQANSNQTSSNPNNQFDANSKDATGIHLSVIEKMRQEHLERMKSVKSYNGAREQLEDNPDLDYFGDIE